jgi:hypothetical protein
MTKAVGFLQGSSGDQSKFLGIFIYCVTHDYLLNDLIVMEVKLRCSLENSRNSSRTENPIILEDRFLI